MALQMTRAEYEAKYGKSPVPLKTPSETPPAPVRMTRAEYTQQFGYTPGISPAPQPQNNERGLLESIVKRPLERLVIEPAIRTGQAIGSAVLSPFLNEEQTARMEQSLSQDTKLNIPLFGEFTSRGLKNGKEGVKQIVGETAETAGYLAPTGKIAGALTPALGKVAANSAAGAATGYAFDVGTKLQNGGTVSDALKPGVGTAAGAIIPVLGAVIGKLPKRLEEVNLRMTPTEKANLAKQGKDIAAWTAKHKLTGTPEVRYEKVNQMYADMERQVSRVIDGSKITYPKQSIIARLEQIPKKYAENLSEYEGVVSKIGKMIRTLQETRGDSISAPMLNKMKRAEWTNAYNKQGSQVINEVSDDVGHAFKEILDNSIPALKKINPEYGTVIAARKVLHKAISRPQTGLVGKLLGGAAGAGVGGALGGGVGAAGGAIIGEQVAAKALGTATRSRAGAIVQSVSDILSKVPTDKAGNLQITQKEMINLLQGLLGPDIDTEGQFPIPQQSSPQSNTLSPEQQAAVRRGVDIGKMVDPTGTVGAVEKVGLKVGAKALANIHPDDLHLMHNFIDYARLGKNMSDEAFAQAEKLAEHFGISMDIGLKRVARKFEDILDGDLHVPDTVLQARDALGRFTGSK